MAFEEEVQSYQDNLSEQPSDAHFPEMNPFRGLEFFDSEHAPFFNGRTKVVGEVLDVLRQQVAEKKPFVLVLGPAASGKTSFVRAGILPVLTQVGITEKHRSWRLAFTRPGNGGAGDPFDALAAALLEKSALPEFPDAAAKNGWQSLAAELREAPENAALRLREALQYLSMRVSEHFLDEQAFQVAAANPEASVELPPQSKLDRVESKVQLALVVDQLEELFVGGFSPELQQKYIAALGALVNWRVAFVVATLRSDFHAAFQKCCNPKELAVLNQPELRVRDIDLSEVLAGRFDLPPPGPEEIREMIRMPAEAAGLRFELDPETGRTLDAALLEAGISYAEPLPPLEHLLWQLYRKQLPRKDGLLRWSDYRESGGLEGALANHAENVFSALDEDAQAALRPVVQQLVSPGPGEDGVLIRRTVPYRDLTSTPGFSEHQKAGAERLIELFIKEGLFHTERGPNAEVLVCFTQECAFRNWPRVRELLDEDLALLRARDRLEPNFNLWFSGGRRSCHLVRTGSGIRDAAVLLRGFRTSLSDPHVDYLQRSLRARNRRRWFRGTAVLAIAAALAAPFVIPGVQWLRANMERRKAEQSSGPEGRVAHSGNTRPESFEAEQRQKGNSAQLSPGNAALATSQRDALQTQLKDTEAKAQQAQKDAALATSQRDALQTRLKDTEAKAQQVQKDAELVTSQREALQNQLKDTEGRAQQAQKDAALATSQRDALQSQLKELTQKNAELPADQRHSWQTQLSYAEARAQQAQKYVELVTSQRDALQGQRDALQGQLKDTEAKAQQARKDVELVASQRDALQGQLKDTEAKAQQAQKNVELVTSQRDALQTQLKDTEAKAQQAQQAQKEAALATSQRDALQTQLKDTEAKAQQAQKDAALAISQRDALQTQLKDTEAKAQQGQKEAALAISQRDALQTRLKDTEAKAQQAQKDATLAISQRDALQTQLKDTEAKAQQGQKEAALAISQRDALQTRLKDTEAKAQQAQKDADLMARERDAQQTQLEPAQRREPAATYLKTEQTQPAKLGLNPERPTSTQPPDSSVRSAQPTLSIAGSAIPAPPAAQTDIKGLAEEQSLKEFVHEYIRTVANNDASTQLRFFEPRVSFYREGLISRQRIQKAIERYQLEWPVRNWEPRGEPEFPNILHSTNPKLYEVLQPLTWTVSNGLQRKQGTVTLYLRIWKNDKGEFHIVHVEQRNP